MSDPTVTSAALDSDSLLAQADEIHDIDPVLAAELLREIGRAHV